MFCQTELPKLRTSELGPYNNSSREPGWTGTKLGWIEPDRVHTNQVGSGRAGSDPLTVDR